VVENGLVDAKRALEQGRRASGDWRDAFDALARANQERPLAPEDLELLAASAYMLGLDNEYRGALEHAYHAYRDGGDALRAARCAWWIGHNLMSSGNPRRPAVVARGQRLLEHEDRDSVERGYLLIPTLSNAPAKATSLLSTRPRRRSRRSDSGSATRTSWRSR
jgi:hypothetical protein